MLPNFLIIGAPKAGTTSLWKYLGDHPQIFVAKSKEVDFFVAERNWSLGRGWYEGHFEGSRGAIAVGEASVNYSRYPRHQGVPGRIARLLPDVRLIYLVRHPIDRMISDYKMHVQQRWEKQPIGKALLNNPLYLDCSRYAMQIDPYLEHFPRERFLIVRSEDLKNARAASVRLVYEFLGVDGSTTPASLDRELNPGGEVRAPRSIHRALPRIPGYKPLASITPPSLKRWKRRLTTQELGDKFKLPERIRLELEERLRPDVQRLRAYMGEAFDGWGIG